jgi:curved DNA-binding protein CbpA
MADHVDPYKTLQVDPEAEDEVVQAAYRRLARKYHPDVASGAEAAARMAAINAAWALIGKPERRVAYDAERTRSTRRGLRPATSRGPAASRASANASGQAEGEPLASSPPPPESVSRDWTSGRSSEGGGYDESMRMPEGVGAAGAPPGQPWGSVLTFGRFAGWSLGEVARHEIEYIEWLDRAPIGRQYRDEIDQLLRSAGRRRSAEAQDTERRGLFRRR